MHLDSYNEELRLAFEFQGSQYYHQQKIHDQKKHTLIKKGFLNSSSS
ncbi:18781_t:CDS:2 [Funneliformis geosporum]|uniref:18781_t:CDS:1 n=1 Tax=Funneliformis geosporum TaxID=1117311 RepID=A0A9W4WUB0_9GLOM|nr:18781_t:CDS:2 [Funneliformis geosporum]